MTTNHQRAERWAQRILKPELRELAANGNVYARGDTIFSYGSHFPMADVYRDSARRATHVVVNGDTYSVSTSGHQSMVRGALRAHAPDVPTVIIPYTALRAAGIDHASIIVLDSQPEGWTYSEQTGDDLPTGATASNGQDLYRGKAYVGNAPDVPCLLDGQGHWQVIDAVNGRHRWHTARHWLGESVIAARVNGSRRRVKFLSGFDRNERERLYFLCQLPATAAVTVDEAIEALKPDTVRMAEAMGRTCQRQGDIFGVPMPGMTWADLKALGGTLTRRTDARRGILTEARENVRLESLVQAEDVRFRTPDYLQHRENMRGASWGRPAWGSRRVTPLDPGWGVSPARAEARARANAVANHRREKWEGILRDRVQAAQAASAPAAGISLLGTSHTATHVVTMPDGTQYGKGTMYHDPRLMGEWRDPDHARCKLGDGATWHLIQKNTVPVARGAARARTIR